ncbi:MAG: ABC transporter permease [Firmicutes bacterium]|nr:ABC transporter permease [Bacillota bacterium]
MAENSALVSFLALLIFAILVKGSTFLDPNNIMNILRNNSVIGIAALGMTLIIITAGIDLAVGSQLALLGILIITVLNSTQNIFVAIIAGLVCAVALGFLTGEAVARFRIPAFIVTLGTMSIYRSVSQFWLNGGGVTTQGDAGSMYIKISNTSLFGFVPMPIIIWLACAAVIFFFTNHTATGRQVYAVGSNEKAAKLAGVNVTKVITIVYIIAAVLIMVAAITETSRLGSVNSASSGTGYEMDAIAAAVIGGTNMAGGRGTVVGTILGTLTLGIIDNLMNLMGVDPFLVKAVKGAIIIIAVLLQSILNRKSN